MKKIILTAIALCLSLSAQADVIKCVFTEPFINTTYSTSQQTLTYASLVGENAKKEISIIKNVSFQIKSAGNFELVSKDGKILQTLELNNNGSDGMSDTTYPYEVKDSSQIMMTSVNFGGCTSNYLKTK